MRKALGFLAVLLVLLAVGLLAADRVLHARTEAQLGDAVAREVDGGSSVVVHGFPFLTQVATGALDHVSLEADAWTDGTVRLERITADGYDVTTAEPYTAARARGSAVVPLESLQALVDGLGAPVPLRVGLDEGRVTLAAEVLGGVELALAADVVPAGAGVELEVVEAFLGGVAVSLEDVGLGPGLRTLEVPLDGLPEGLAVDDVEVLDDGVRVRVSGRDVVLELAG